MIISEQFVYEKFKFPCGEPHIKLNSLMSGNEAITVGWAFESIEELFDLFLIQEILIRHGRKIQKLILDYVPFSRQDRVTSEMECFSLKTFCTLLNKLEADIVQILDPHSDVTPALINNCTVLSSMEAWKYVISFKGPSKIDFDKVILVCPDGGSLKKTYAFAKEFQPHHVVECSKERNILTGEILRTVVHADDLFGMDCVILDDICDGGRTFTEIAKVLKEKNAGKIILMVSHGFFTKGLEVFDGLIDEIYCLNKGKVK